MKNVIIISGATATGKTKISIELAKKHNGQIVNFDSLLFYKELNIGTAKPTISERKAVNHHIVDVSNIKNPLNAADFVKIAIPIIEDLHSKNITVFLVGGSGFYLRALTDGMYDSPTTPQDIIKRSEIIYKENGIEPFIEILNKHDPETISKLHANDHYRIRRAVEHFWSTGTKFSEVRKQQETKKQTSKSNIREWNIHHVYLQLPKEKHWEIILNRTKEMISNGLIEEVKNLLQSGFTTEESPLQSIGYKETIQYINNQIISEEDLVERIFISTRQLSKSQRTWFNNISNKKTYNPLDDYEEIDKDVSDFLRNHQ